MRKIFTTLKSVVAVALVAAMTLSVSCSYDDTGIKKEIANVKADLAALAERVSNLEKNLQHEVPTLEDLLNGKLVIVNVSTDAEGNKVLELSNGEKITVIGECKYEPCDHECEPCDCNPLQYRVVDGVLEVSADGENWIAVNGVSADQVVANVVINEDGTATITLANGEEFTVVKAELIECEATRSQVFVAPGETKSIKFTINDAVSDVNVMNQPLGWTASIEVAPVVEDENNVDPGMGILAAGGADFLLNITGPSADFVNAGYAQKEGFVAVHFNSANGGCKVAKVAVNLAELGISVDASGNITVTNSVAKAAGFDEMGEPLYDFADFFIGIVDAADYATYGDKVFVDTFDDYTYEYTANVASTQRTTGFQNIVDLQWYEAGACEKEVYTLTVDQLAGAFWPKYEYEMGKEYIIFVTTESEMANYVEQPVLTNAAKASYKRVFVEANLNKETTTWNDATVDFTLAGYNYYIVGWLPVADLEQFVEYGQAADIDSALVFYLKNGGNLMGAGAVVADMQGTYKLSELAALSVTQWAPMLNADTEYLFFVYPMNAETEMEFYTHQVVEENIRNYGSFRTKALVQGSFDAAAEFELVTLDENNVAVNATFGEDVVTVAYNWSVSSYMDPEEGATFILGDIYYTEFVTFGEAEHAIAASNYKYYGIPESYYLCVLAINAAGEYVYVEYDVRSEQGGSAEPEPEPEVLVMDSIARANFKDSKLQFFHQVDGANVYCAGFYNYDVVDTDKMFIPEGEYVVGYNFYAYGYSDVYDYVAKGYNYTFDEGGVMKVSEVNGAYHIEFSGTLNDGTVVLDFVYDGLIENLILPSEYVAPAAFDFTPVRAELDNKMELYEYNGGDAEYAFWLYDEANNYIEVVCKFGPHTGWDYQYSAAKVVDGVRTEATEIATQAPSDYNCEAGQKYFVINATFADSSVIKLALQLSAVEVNYLGEGSTYAPGSENQGGNEEPEVIPEFVIPGEGVAYDLDYRYTKLVSGLDGNNAVRVAQDNGYIWDLKFNPGLTEIVAGDYTAVQSFTTADALELDTYNGGIQFGEPYSFFYADVYDNVTINVQKEGDYYCITLISQSGYDCPVSGQYRLVYIGKIK